MDWENHLEKKSDPKTEETVTIEVKFPYVNKKPLARKQIFVQTPFSLCFKIRVKNFHDAKLLAFLPHFIFRRDQNHYFNLTSKIAKMCEQIVKKDSAPIQFKFIEL